MYAASAAGVNPPKKPKRCLCAEIVANLVVDFGRRLLLLSLLFFATFLANAAAVAAAVAAGVALSLNI